MKRPGLIALVARGRQPRRGANSGNCRGARGEFRMGERSAPAGVTGTWRGRGEPSTALAAAGSSGAPMAQAKRGVSTPALGCSGAMKPGCGSTHAALVWAAANRAANRPGRGARATRSSVEAPPRQRGACGRTRVTAGAGSAGRVMAAVGRVARE